MYYAPIRSNELKGLVSRLMSTAQSRYDTSKTLKNAATRFSKTTIGKQEVMTQEKGAFLACAAKGLEDAEIWRSVQAYLEKESNNYHKEKRLYISNVIQSVA